MMNHIRWRNSYVIWPGLSISLASTTMFFMGTFLNYHEICAVAFVLSVILFLLFCFFIPESPLWLYHRGRIGDAEWSQKKLGIIQPILTKHFNGESQPTLDYDATGWKNFKENLRKAARKDVYKPLIILSLLGVILQLVGAFPVMTYMIDIIDNKITGADQNISIIEPPFKFDGDRFDNTLLFLQNRENSLNLERPHIDKTTPWDTYKYTLVSGFLMIIANVIATFGLPYFGIRKLLLLSELSSVFGMVLLTYSSVADSFQLRVSSVWIIAFMFSLTVAAPQAVAGEAFPRDAKGFASVSHLTTSFASSAVVNTYPHLRLALGEYVYCLYAVGGIICALYTYVFVPEIIGRTVEQVNEEFSSRL